MAFCKKCDTEKPLTTEFWKPNKASASGWLMTMCRDCYNEYYRNYSKNNPEWRREKEAKYKEKHPEKVAEKLKRSHEKQRIEGKNKYCNRNQEKARQRDKLRWQNNAARREWDRQRWEKRKQNGYNEHERLRYKTNPLPKILKANKRRVMKLGAKGSHSEQQLLWKYQYYGGRCFYCREELSKEKMTEDHRIPLSRGGSDWASNIVPACMRCNSRKGNKKENEYAEWLKNNGFDESKGGGCLYASQENK